MPKYRVIFYSCIKGKDSAYIYEAPNASECLDRAKTDAVMYFETDEDFDSFDAVRVLANDGDDYVTLADGSTARGLYWKTPQHLRRHTRGVAHLIPVSVQAAVRDESHGTAPSPA